MKPLVKVRIGSFRKAVSWIIRFVLVVIIALLIYKIYPINPFFVIVSGGILFFLSLIIPEEKIVADEDVLVITKYFCFNLFRIQKLINLDEVKDVIVAGNTNFSSNLKIFIFPYLERGYNEVRILYEGDVKTFRTAIYMVDLLVFEKQIQELILNKKKPNSFSQPIYRAD